MLTGSSAGVSPVVSVLTIATRMGTPVWLCADVPGARRYGCLPLA
ncbi:hypothetical protein CBM2589_B190132 [Cupriavidus taiwanensis]|uniref:Uncharacterized protein n=1 Tax=Cupriavidus taiwanensis TaxID=164546 RepID=A0A975ZZQ8_9BURK|nr:hypothetical protein CBM2589_B190132 [Cupriavidus taiwanensis]